MPLRLEIAEPYFISGSLISHADAIALSIAFSHAGRLLILISIFSTAPSAT
jgi:hypothetical protein